MPRDSVQIARLGATLSWTGADEGLAAPYDDALADGLGEVLGRLETHDPRSGSELAARLSRLGPDEFQRLLGAPETSCRLLHPRRHELAGVAAFLGAAAEAEALRRDGGEPEAPLWTALGDFRAVPQGAPYRAPRLGGAVLDFEGPHANDLNRNAATAASFGAANRYEAEARARLARRLAAVLADIEAVNPFTARFVARYTRVILLVKDPAAGRFMSRSPERRVGLTLLANADSADLDDVELAESLIHEAIHSLVETAETLANRAARPGDRWISDPALYDGVLCTVSPWTHTRLVAPTYVHACFVWYGIVRFWACALEREVFPIGRVQDRLRASMRGFLSPAMLSQLEPFRGALHPDLTASLAQLGKEVRMAFDAVLTA